jgi:hypothetical protein
MNLGEPIRRLRLNSRLNNHLHVDVFEREVDGLDRYETWVEEDSTLL